MLPWGRFLDAYSNGQIRNANAITLKWLSIIFVTYTITPLDDTAAWNNSTSVWLFEVLDIQYWRKILVFNIVVSPTDLKNILIFEKKTKLPLKKNIIRYLITKLWVSRAVW